ncbi:hypothetical protein P9112_002057 [Eukaryota sp. TZLM1-RC]
MSNSSQQDIPDIQQTSSPHMQQQQDTSQPTSDVHKDNEVTDSVPTSSLTKEKDEGVDEVLPSTKLVERGTKEEVTRTDPAPSPLKKKGLSTVVTRTDPAPSPLPNIKSVTKGTNGNPTLDTSFLLGEYEKNSISTR